MIASVCACKMFVRVIGEIFVCVLVKCLFGYTLNYFYWF